MFYWVMVSTTLATFFNNTFTLLLRSKESYKLISNRWKNPEFKKMKENLLTSLYWMDNKIKEQLRSNIQPRIFQRRKKMWLNSHLTKMRMMSSSKQKFKIKTRISIQIEARNLIGMLKQCLNRQPPNYNYKMELIGRIKNTKLRIINF